MAGRSRVRLGAERSADGGDECEVGLGHRASLAEYAVERGQPVTVSGTRFSWPPPSHLTSYVPAVTSAVNDLVVVVRSSTSPRILVNAPFSSA